MGKISGTKITSYFGWATIGLEWVGALSLILMLKPNLSEPFSQYGYYDATKLVFGLFFTSVSIIYFLFSRHLNRYWRYSSICSLLAGIAFIITGWSPYTPGAGTFVMDVHNIALVVSMLLFTLPMIGISYAKKHNLIAVFSNVLFYIVTTVSLVSLLARATNIWVIYAQLATIVVFHFWLGIINYLVVQHESNHDTDTRI